MEIDANRLGACRRYRQLDYGVGHVGGRVPSGYLGLPDSRLVLGAYAEPTGLALVIGVQTALSHRILIYVGEVAFVFGESLRRLSVRVE